MRVDMVPWRGVKNTPSSSPSFFMPSQTRKILLWIGNVVSKFFISLFFCSLFSNVVLTFVLVIFPIHSCIRTFAHLVVLGGSIIAYHIVVMELDIDICKCVLFPKREPEQKHIFQHVALSAQSPHPSVRPNLDGYFELIPFDPFLLMHPFLMSYS